jgi:outer membrane protein assembly factor BamB
MRLLRGRTGLVVSASQQLRCPEEANMPKTTPLRDVYRVAASMTFNREGLRGFIAVLLLATPPMSALAQPIEEDFKLTADDAGWLHRFGGSVAIDGPIAIVGSPSSPSPLIGTGAAYVFDTSTGQQLLKLEANDASEDDLLGSSVALSGNIAVVGAFGDDSAAFNAGAAYVFDVSTGEQLFKLTASDANASMEFGTPVAISGSRVIVGARDARQAGIAKGAAYVFDLTTGEQLHKLSASDAQLNDQFGFAVAIDGTIAVVGAPTADSDGPSARLQNNPVENCGAVYVFDLTTGEELLKLHDDDLLDNDFFGRQVAISGTRVAISSSQEENIASYAGSVLVFDLSTEQTVRKLTACDGLADNGFGYTLALSGSTAVMGALWDENGAATGNAYIVDIDTGTLLHRLRASDGEVGDAFGNAVDIRGGSVIIGASRDSDAGTYSGSAYIYTLPPTNPCHGDVTGDYRVDMADLNLVLSAFGQNAFCGDATGGGVVDLADLNLVLANYGRTCD